MRLQSKPLVSSMYAVLWRSSALFSDTNGVVSHKNSKKERAVPRRVHLHHPFCLAIVGVRDGAKVPQGPFATAAGVSVRTIVNWENGYKLPSRAQALVLVENLLASGYDRDDLEVLAGVLNVSHLLPLPPQPVVVPPAPVVVAPVLPSLDVVRRAVEHALYDAAEETDVPIRAARRLVVAVLEAMAGVGASAEQARSVVAREKAPPS